MGQMIGVWAPLPRTGRTTATLAIAYKLSERLDKNKRILVCCANGSNNALMRTMGITEEDLGIEDIVSYKLAGIDFNDVSSMLVRKGRLFFAGSSKITANFSNTFISGFNDVFETFRDIFDITLVDLPSGKDSPLCNSLLGKCDQIISIVDQDISNFRESTLNIRSEKKNILLINKYKKIYPTKSDIKSMLKTVDYIYEVPECNVLLEMKNRGKLFQYFSLDTEFNSTINTVISDILMLCGYNTPDVNAVNEHSRRLFSRVKINALGGQ